MRIKKTSTTATLPAQVVNTASDSTNDAYSCDYINNCNTYSTSETFTGEYWENGEPIYRKLYKISLSNNSNITQAHNLGSLSFWTLNQEKSCVFKSGTESLPANWYYSASDYARTWVNSASIRFVSPGSLSGYTLYAVIDYVKTTNRGTQSNIEETENTEPEDVRTEEDINIER